MSDKTEPKDLEMVLSRLKKEWEELTDLLTSQAKSQDRVIEVEKILLRDASGQYRGKISANPDGSTDLLLGDSAGDAWARLGVNQDGAAFLELKDQKGESSFKVAVSAPSLEAGAGPAATPADGLDLAVPQPTVPAEAEGAPLAESVSVSAPIPPESDEPVGCDPNSGIFDRLEKLARQYRRLKIFGALILVVLGAIMATQASVLLRGHPPGLTAEDLVLRDKNGNIRATLGAADGKVRLDLWDQEGHRRATLGLGAEGSPGLAFYDREQRVRAELNLAPDGEPKFTLRDKRSLQGQTEPNTSSDSGNQQHRRGTVSGTEEGTVTTPPAGQAITVPPKREAEAELELVGSRTSNKYLYHYPTCSRVKAIKPLSLIKFKSAAEAQARRYVPCPVCKPPR